MGDNDGEQYALPISLQTDQQPRISSVTIYPFDDFGFGDELFEFGDGEFLLDTTQRNTHATYT